MKYYLIIVQNNETVAIYSYNSMNDALAAYHTELAYRNEARTSTECAILNADLQVMIRESYVAPTPVNPTPEPTPEPEPEPEPTPEPDEEPTDDEPEDNKPEDNEPTDNEPEDEVPTDGE